MELIVLVCLLLFGDQISFSGRLFVSLASVPLPTSTRAPPINIIEPTVSNGADSQSKPDRLYISSNHSAVELVSNQTTSKPNSSSVLNSPRITCSDNDHCSRVAYSYCNIGTGQCVCHDGYSTATNGTCIRVLIKQPNSFTEILHRTPVLPILVVFGVMFVCLCLVLQLFSKARFRNSSRSIFANPQTLKVAQAQERRMSQLSQLSTSGLRTPRTPNRSPNYSNRSTRGSYGSNIYPPYETPGYGEQYNTAKSVLLKAKSRSNSISSSKLF